LVRLRSHGRCDLAHDARVYTLRGGKIVRGREYIDRDQALEALRLRE
jgi:ketosteroid isomerase-like protein